MTRVYTIWPADHSGQPATGPAAWQQESRWLVLDVTGGDAHVVEGPVSRTTALRRELELRAVARQTAKANKQAAREGIR